MNKLRTRYCSRGSLLALAALAAACGSDSSDAVGTHSSSAGNTNDGDDAGSDNGGTSGTISAQPTQASDPSAPLVGKFTVSMPPADPATGVTESAAFQGVVRDGPAVEMTSWAVLESDDFCTLYEPSIPFCDPACASGAACVTGNVCQTYPTAHSLGPATITGLELADGTREFSITPLRPNFNYLPGASITLLNPPLAEGAAMQLTTAGGDYEPITLVALGIAPLDFHGEGGPLLFAPDAALLLEWTTPQRPDQSEIWVEVDISHHGGIKGKINCTAPDTGSLEIQQSMVSGLIDLGVAGYPTITLMRRSVGFANVEPGRVALEIISDLTLPLDIPGLVSCAGPEDCDAGQTCGTDRTCQ
jgi:hypothetical protein